MWTTGGSATRRGSPLAAHVGAVARVAQAGGGDLARVDRAEREALLELGAAGQDAAVLVDGDAVSVEDQLVLAADGVHEHDGGEVVDRPLDEHPLAAVPVADAVGRGRQVHDHLRAGQRLGHRGRPRLPDVLADGDPDRDPVQLEDRPPRRRTGSSAARRRRRSWAGTSCGRWPRPRRRPAPPRRCRRPRRSRGSRPARRCRASGRPALGARPRRASRNEVLSSRSSGG